MSVPLGSYVLYPDLRSPIMDKECNTGFHENIQCTSPPYAATGLGWKTNHHRPRPRPRCGCGPGAGGTGGPGAGGGCWCWL